MIRRAFAVSAVLALLAGATASLGVAGTPPGPRLAFVELQSTTGSEKAEGADPPIMSLVTIGASGGGRRRLVHSNRDGSGRIVPAPFVGPSWSPQGTRLAFGTDVGREQRKIYLVDADGRHLRPIPGTEDGSNPVLSPDGHTLAFARSRFRFHIDPRHLGHTRSYSSETTWVVDLEGGGPKRLTPWRNGPISC